MPKAKSPENKIIEAAFGLAARHAWQDVRMRDIAAEAKMSLSELSAHVASKTDIISLFARHVDQAMLDSLENEPVTGNPNDRLFDIIMRRLEHMEPHKAAIRSILAQPTNAPTDYLPLAGSLLRSQGWILTAADLEGSGTTTGMRVGGLAFVYVRTLRTWVNDDDAGLAKTMATLDRSLRDGADWMKRLEAPAMLAGALSSLAKGFFKARKDTASNENTPSEPPVDTEKTEQDDGKNS